MTKKLVIEIDDKDGRTQLLKRRNGVVKFLDNIDSMFKRGSIVRAIEGVKMFFVDEAGGGFEIPEGPDLSNETPLEVNIDPGIPDGTEVLKAAVDEADGPEPGEVEIED